MSITAGQLHDCDYFMLLPWPAQQDLLLVGSVVQQMLHVSVLMHLSMQWSQAIVVGCQR